MNGLPDGGSVRPVPTGPRGGFTMIEVIISIVILTVGVVAMAGTTAFIVQQTTFADLMTERAAAFQTTVSRLQAANFDSVSSGSDSLGVFNITWSTENVGSQSKIVTIVTVGPGLDTSAVGPGTMSPTATETFVFRLLRY